MLRLADLLGEDREMLTAQSAIRAMRVLIVDGDLHTRGSLAERLRKDGFENVSEVGSGSEALQVLSSALASQQPADLVCLGLNLPDRSVLQAFEEIRRVFNTGLLLLGEGAGGEPLTEGLRLGADEFIPLPVNLELFLLKTQRLLTRRFLKRELRRASSRNEMLFLNVLSVMVKMLEAKDPFARFHSENVSTLAAAAAREMGLQDDEVYRIGRAGVLHDLGKLGIQEAILNKPGPLTTQEREIVRRHALIASTILEPIEQLQGALTYIRHHHEHYDGSGYPVGLAGEAIPLGARIIHAAEAFDAMTSRHTYSEARSTEDALREMYELSGIQFDPEVVEALTAVIRHRGPVVIRGPEARPLPLTQRIQRLSQTVAVDREPPRPEPPTKPAS
jgi:response regulator RpfG family c-di-GMP phosphodiesterase